MTGFITSNTTLTVANSGAMFTTSWAAMDYLMDYIIYPRAKVTIQMASGDYVHTSPLPNHPQNLQIEIIGPTLTFPTKSDFVVTGYSSAARLSNNANHLTMLKSKFGAKIECQDCSFIDSRYGYGFHTITNALLWSDGATDIGVYMYGALGYLNNVSIHGWKGLLIALVNGGHIRPSNITLSGGATNGLQASDCSTFKSTNTFVSVSNGNMGIFVKRCAAIEAYQAYLAGNAADGALIQDDGIIEVSNSEAELNGGSGFKVELGGSLNADSSTSHDNAEHGFQVAYGGNIFAANSSADHNALAGYRAERPGSFIDMRNANSISNGTHGLHILYGAKADASGSFTTLSSNDSSGVRIDDGGTVFMQNSNVSGNASRGIYVVTGGDVDAENAYISSNGGNEVQVANAGNVRVTGTGLTNADVSPALNTPSGTANQALIWT